MAEPKLLALKTFLFHTRKALSSGASMRHILPWLGMYIRHFGNRPTVQETPPRPWLSYPVTRWLKNHLHADMRVFEYGAGTSTLFFASRVKELISVEHDADWFHQLKAIFEAQNSIKLAMENKGFWQLDYASPNGRHQLFLIPPQEGFAPDPAYTSLQKPAYKGSHFHHYAHHIDGFPDAYFDLILIDGRARNACLRQAWPKLKAGGYLLFDDSHREHYAQPDFLDLASSTTIIGPGPGSGPFHQTSIFRKS